ncbi:TetR/AcrR family transcriptional regulator [Yersinia sp. 2540 StPb PI]|uniref:TetR/AcrR family transcriptional regulator n=1 Tax=Yersinia sp. 2540 StPb PI TaxID=3117406 RepID=UPI003FA49BD6
MNATMVNFDKKTRGRGRPKIFDRESVLDKAMVLFWAHGYEGTSLSDLVKVTGAKAPTLYAEFGNKEGLFRAAMERYIENFDMHRKEALECTEGGVAQRIENYFRSVAACFTDRNKPAGCFVICNSMALAESSGDVARMLLGQHHTQEVMLRDFLEKCQQHQELPSDTDVARVAQYLSCILQGMSVRAREGATLIELGCIIDTFINLWPVLIITTIKNT